MSELLGSMGFTISIEESAERRRKAKYLRNREEEKERSVDIEIS